MKRKIFAKVVAIIALFAILLWVIWTWALLVYEWVNNTDNIWITKEQLDELIKSYSWNLSSSWVEYIEENSLSWITENTTNTWIIK